MNTDEENLFAEIQIMTPEELNRSIEEKERKENGEEAVENQEGSVLKPVEKTTEEVKENTSTETSTTSTTDGLYKALIKELYDSGIITLEESDKLEEIEGTKESLKNLVSKTVELNVKQKETDWKKGFTGAKKRFLEIEDAFTETDKAIVMAQRLDFFDTLTEEKIKGNKDLQKQLYFEDLKIKNFSEEKALAAIEDAEALGKLEERSLQSLPDLKKHASDIVTDNKNKIDSEKIKNDEEVTKSFEALVNSIDSLEHLIPGLPLNKIAKDKLKATIITPVYKDENGKEYNSLMYKQSKNPAEFEKLINYFDMLGLFNMDEKTGTFKPDISKLKTAAKTEVVTELDKIIVAQDKKRTGSNTAITSDSERGKRILEGLEGVFKEQK